MNKLTEVDEKELSNVTGGAVDLPSNYWGKYGAKYDRVSPTHIWNSSPNSRGKQSGGLAIA